MAATRVASGGGDSCAPSGRRFTTARGQPEGGPALAPMGTERQQGPPWLKWCAGGFLLPIEFGTGCARSPSRSVFLGLSHESQPARRNLQATIPKRLGPGQSRPAALFSEWCPTCSARKFPRTPRGGAHHPPGECGVAFHVAHPTAPQPTTGHTPCTF